MAERNLREELDKQSAKDRIILPLDVATIDQAFGLVEQLVDHIGMVKIGFEFQQMILKNIMADPAKWPNESALSNIMMFRSLVARLAGNIFWDCKFHDIPNTVGGAANAVAGMTVKMFNVHASGDVESMKRAVENAGNAYVLAVTVLTSISPERCGKIYGVSNGAAVLDLVELACEAGVHGIICSPQEVGLIRRLPEYNHLALITPGVRPEWASANDQKRVMTPFEAIKAGADALVIGRPITEAANPVKACHLIAEEIREGLKSRCAACTQCAAIPHI